jgi:hypothetical protein
MRSADRPPPPLHDALRWLARHQDARGSWDADGLMAHDPGDDRCDGAGGADRDVEVTALALLAFLGDGHTSRVGAFRTSVARAAEWLLGQQDAASGLLGPPRSHAIATLALCELAALDDEPRIRAAALVGRCSVGAAFQGRSESPGHSPPLSDADASGSVLVSQSGISDFEPRQPQSASTSMNTSR